MRFLLIAIVSLFITKSFSQDVESELGFIYVKAEYLYETERLDEAIQQYTLIVKQNPSFKDALAKRAHSKYKAGNFNGAKMDALQSFESVGVSLLGVKVHGLASYYLEDFSAASGSLDVSQRLGSNDLDIAEALAESYYMTDQMDLACDAAAKAKALGSKKLSSEMKKYCSSSKGTAELPKNKTGKKKTRPKPKQDDVIVDSEDEEIIEDSEDELKDELVVDDKENKIEVDEDLDLIIKNGLGSRKILDQPNILILSDQSGEVVVDVCVNKAGRVTSAELNAEDSTIDTSSLQDLAIRKSKEFWFERMGRDEMCGTIVFLIKGR